MTEPIKAKIYSMEPVLPVNDLEVTLEYYRKTLGFRIDWTWPEEGKADHASVSFGEGHEGQSHEDHHIHIQLSQADDLPVSNAGWLYLRVEKDIESLYELMKKQGANIITELEDQPWGMREFNVKDNNGHLFRFAYAIPEE